MPVWLEIIIVNAVIGLACYTRGLYLELKSTKKQLDQVKDINKSLIDMLRSANEQIQVIKYGKSKTNSKPANAPQFLLADDPMDELLKHF